MRRTVQALTLVAAAGLLVACAATVPVSVSGPVAAPAARPGGAAATASHPAAPAPSAAVEPPIEPVAQPEPPAAEAVNSAAAEAADLPVEAAAAGPEPILARGLASWYGEKFHGRRTASGEGFDMHDFTAAHRTLPFGSRVRVRSVRTGQEVVVRINDRGPHRHRRIIDLSWAAFVALGLDRRGVIEVILLRE